MVPEESKIVLGQTTIDRYLDMQEKVINAEVNFINTCVFILNLLGPGLAKEFEASCRRSEESHQLEIQERMTRIKAIEESGKR